MRLDGMGASWNSSLVIFSCNAEVTLFHCKSWTHYQIRGKKGKSELWHSGPVHPSLQKQVKPTSALLFRRHRPPFSHGFSMHLSGMASINVYPHQINKVCAHSIHRPNQLVIRWSGQAGDANLPILIADVIFTFVLLDSLFKFSIKIFGNRPS